MNVENLADLSEVTIKILDECSLKEVQNFAEGAKQYFEMRKQKRLEILEKDIAAYEECIAAAKQGIAELKNTNICG